MASILPPLASVKCLCLRYCRFYLEGGTEQSTLATAAQIIQVEETWEEPAIQLTSLELFAYSSRQDTVPFFQAVTASKSLQRLHCHGMHGRSFGHRGTHSIGSMLS